MCCGSGCVGYVVGGVEYVVGACVAVWGRGSVNVAYVCVGYML